MAECKRRGNCTQSEGGEVSAYAQAHVPEQSAAEREWNTWDLNKTVSGARALVDGFAYAVETVLPYGLPVPSGMRSSGPAISRPYARPSNATTAAQRQSVQGKPCVTCGEVAPRQVADHIEPLVKEYYRTGTIDVNRMRSVESVQSQCPTCSARQGAYLSQFSIWQPLLRGLE